MPSHRQLWWQSTVTAAAAYITHDTGTDGPISAANGRADALSLATPHHRATNSGSDADPYFATNADDSVRMQLDIASVPSRHQR